jgi:hypothetical protein
MGCSAWGLGRRLTFPHRKNTLLRIKKNKTSSLTLREERRLRVFENKVLTRIFGPKRDVVTGGWR